MLMPEIQRPPLSQVLLSLVARETDAINLGELAEVFGSRAKGMLLALLALPVLAAGFIPGVSTVFGSVLLFLSAQLCLGKQDLWLPRRIRDMRISTTVLKQALDAARPWLHRIERRMRPRYTVLTEGLGVRFVGLLLLVNVLVLMGPIPFGNLVPAVVVLLSGIGLAERDGLVVLFSIALCVLFLGLFGGVLLTLLRVFLSAVAL